MNEINHSKKYLKVLIYGLIILGLYAFAFYSKDWMIEDDNDNNNNLIISEKTNDNWTKITDIQTEWNLQVTNDISCLNISDLNWTNLNLANYTPADLSRWIQKCIKE